MGVKISELPAASALAGTEPLPLVQATETRKATVADIAPVRSVAGKTGEVTLDPADCGAAAASHSHSGYEPALGNPASDGQVLASTAAGVRSWVDSASGGGSTTPNLITTTYSVPADTSIMVVDTLEITATGALECSGNVGVW